MEVIISLTDLFSTRSELGIAAFAHAVVGLTGNRKDGAGMLTADIRYTTRTN